MPYRFQVGRATEQKGSILPLQLNPLVFQLCVKKSDRTINASKVVASGKDSGFGIEIQKKK